MGDLLSPSCASGSGSNSTSFEPVSPKPFIPPTLPRLTSPWLSKLLFLGTGTSGQVPAIGCVLPPSPPSKDAQEGAKQEECEACKDALSGNGFQSPNRRGCCSVAVIGGGRRGKGQVDKFAEGQDAALDEDDESLILIDCGPTFYPSALRFFPPHKLRRITALLLTHGHADAILGLDSLRAWTMRGVIQSHVDVYCTQECFETVRDMFPYLVDSSRATGGGGVAGLVFHVISSSTPFTITDAFRPSLPPITIQPLPLLHGFQKGPGSDAFECLGFRINDLSYASDCHHIPPETVRLMRGSEVVVVDALTPTPHPSHFSLAQALSFVCSMGDEGGHAAEGEDRAGGKDVYRGPKLALLTDLTHRLEHRKTEAEVQRWTRDLSSWAALRYDREVQTDAGQDLTKERKDEQMVDGKETKDEAGAGEDKAGKAPAPKGANKTHGQGGGERWWAGAWDERWCETHRADLSLSPSARRELELGAPLEKGVEGLKLGDGDGVGVATEAGEGDEEKGFRARSGKGWHVPELHVAWDGLVVEWDRSE